MKLLYSRALRLRLSLGSKLSHNPYAALYSERLRLESSKIQAADFLSNGFQIEYC